MSCDLALMKVLVLSPEICTFLQPPDNNKKGWLGDMHSRLLREHLMQAV